MSWRGIPILAALGVLGVARILYDPMPATAPAAAINTGFDDATDLSRVDFTPWLSPTTAPTTAPTTRPLADHSSDHLGDPSGQSDQTALTSTKDLLTVLRTFTVQRIVWTGVVSQPNNGILPPVDSFGSPAIDMDDASSSQGLVDFATDSSSGSSFTARSKSSDIAPATPLSVTISSANEPAYSIVGFDIPENGPLPRPTTSLPPISVPEPGMMLLPIFGLGMGRLIRRG